MVSPSSFLDQCVSSAVASRNAPSVAAAEQPPARSFSAVSFSENAHFIRLSLDLPGVLQPDLLVEMQRGVLMIRGMRETPLLANGVRHQHKFCRRFAIDTDVVDSDRLRANLNRRGVLTVMAPKKSLPIVQSVAVTEQDDEEWEQNLMKTYVEEKKTALRMMTMMSEEETEEEEEAQEEQYEEEEEEEMVTEDEETPVEELIRTEIEQAPVEPASSPVQATATATAAPLPNVVSMGSTLDILALAATAGSSLRRTHKSSLHSHLMIRRSHENENTAVSP